MSRSHWRSVPNEDGGSRRIGSSGPPPTNAIQRRYKQGAQPIGDGSKGWTVPAPAYGAALVLAVLAVEGDRLRHALSTLGASVRRRGAQVDVGEED